MHMVESFLANQALRGLSDATIKRLGIDHRPHDLRATFATECARLTGGNMVVVAQLLGHASIQTTQRYVASLPGGREVVDQLGLVA